LIGKPRPGSAIFCGYEYGPGQHVRVEPEELDQLRPAQDRALRLERFLAPAQLDPVLHAGRSSDHRGRITKRGPKTLRKLLVECAWVMLRYNAWARAVYQRLTHGGKTRKKQAIVALARKLLVRCWVMRRDGTAWRGGPVAQTAT
jgi:transposase